jgi:hypothetical protein
MQGKPGKSPDDGKQGPSHAGSIVAGFVGVLISLVLVWFLIGGRISYAASECSKGVNQCVTGIAVALGLVDVYDKDGRCTGIGCNF